VSSDRDLLAAAQDQDRDAGLELWRRHAAYGFAVAQGLAPEDDWEAIASRAWAHIIGSLDSEGAAAGFRPYLYMVIRAVSSTGGRTGADAPLTTAYYRLPPDWREVLWYANAELMKPAQMAPFVGLTTEEVQSVLLRARKGLRQEWVDLHLAGLTAHSLCTKVWERSGAVLGEELPEYEVTWITAHARTCRRCRSALSDTVAVATHLRSTVLPAAAGAGGAAGLMDYLATNGPCVRTVMDLPDLVDGLFPAAEPEPVVEAPRPRPALRTDPALPSPPDDADTPPRQRWIGRVVLAVAVVAAVAGGLIAAGLHLNPTAVTTTPVAPSTVPATTLSETGSPTAPPGAAVILKVDTGRLNDVFPIVSGTAGPAAQVTVHVGETVLTVMADQDGNWTTAGTSADFLDTTGVVTASASTNPEPAAQLFQIEGPPSLKTTVQANQVDFTVTGKLGASANVLVDGQVAATVRLDAAGTSTGRLTLSPGNHFLQVRHAELDRFGPSSVPIVAAVS